MPDLGKTGSGFSFFVKLGIRTLFLSKHPDFNRLTGHFFLSYLMPAQQFAYDYVDKCWIGEGFDYDESPEFWLTEISGIPFGVMSEMMDSGNQYRGLLFGMTNRLGWETNESDPLNIWQLFDDYRLAEAELVGWWDDRNEVVLSNPAVRATEYKLGDEKYIAIANFSSDEQKSDIYIKGDAFNSGEYSFYVPHIERFQNEQTVINKVKLDGGKGLFLIVSKK